MIYQISLNSVIQIYIEFYNQLMHNNETGVCANAVLVGA